MSSLNDMIWIELHKAIRSKIPLWTILGSLLMPLGIAFLIFVARNSEVSQKLGLISVKADLVAYSTTDWPAYLGVTGLVIAAGGFFLYVFATSWVFGREFADGTVKDLLAVPVPRASIILAKFTVVVIWSIVVSAAITTLSLIMGALLKLPGGSLEVIWSGTVMIAATAGLSILTAFPFAWVASIGRGYLLPLGLMVLMVMMTNVTAMTGRGEFFPWAVPGLFAQAKSPLSLISFLLVVLTGVAGIGATHLWWMTADQSR